MLMKAMAGTLLPLLPLLPLPLLLHPLLLLIIEFGACRRRRRRRAGEMTLNFVVAVVVGRAGFGCLMISGV